ncbi:hypothetical protein STCU_10732 [Strigomonas culicis]|uniref:RanBP2-type domain-containing protein n=1 Tax=Strigomonas culicis TaxID=28005 RepID=S9URM9_9TRYP|nr:hypothetical protein STCU_10732 [Strigomonas culicis]|eukprot:EPY17246.1 hypothetical protein STCU_10732 [Strigomonas culicis]
MAPSVGDVPAPSPPGNVTPSRAANKRFELYARVRNTMQIGEGGQQEFAVEWMCVNCLTFNYAGRASCRRCNAPSAASHRSARPPARQVSVFPSLWLCDTCGHTTDVAKSKEETAPADRELSSRSKFFCSHCKTPFGGLRDWYCAACSHLNPLAAVQCATCLTERTPSWTCAGCGSGRNSIFRTECIDCGQERPRKRSDSIVHCPNCKAWNDVRWEICSCCVRPLPMMQECAGRGDATLYAASPPLLKARAAREKSDTPPPPAQPREEGREQSEAKTTATAESGGETPATSTYVHPRASVKVAPPAGVPGSEVEGSWWCCRCNVLLRRNTSFCDICLRPRQVAQLPDRPPSESGGVPAPPRRGEPQAGDWLCPYCRQLRSVQTRRCCSHEREVPQGYWLCPTCCSTNRRDRRTCVGCGAVPHFDKWVCTICNGKNKSGEIRCATCAVPQDHFWTCALCGQREHFTQSSCTACGGARPATEESIHICSVCHAANGASRVTCFRCRERLGDDKWECVRCGSRNERGVLLCDACTAPRPYDFNEVSWVCKICSNVMVNRPGKEEFSRCTLCATERQADCFTFPTRWRCPRCDAGNAAYLEHCQYCAGQAGGGVSSPRVMAELQACVTCTHCCRDTTLDGREQCEHCHGSLRVLFTEMTRSVSLTVSSDVMITDLGRQAQELLTDPDYLR